ncbi:MAG: hypothetical protein EOS78_30855 [Mesorhizobium sp.]|nr:MAG: hypothetical protein EOS78_30855 [Mesorhizobium sp.]
MDRHLKNHSRRALGAYYTSAPVADLLCRWAVRTGTDLVLEPSFGGCEFIAAIQRRLISLGSDAPSKQVMGTDIDPSAFQVLKERGFSTEPTQFKNEDFLSLSTDAFDVPGFDVVVGNPPYVRHHVFGQTIRENAKLVKKAIGIDMPMQANLWAFFLLQATRFLRLGGRAAFVLPHSFLHATYAEKVRQYIATHFKEVQAFSIREHLFENEGASEKSVLLFADGWRQRGNEARSTISMVAVNDIDVVKNILFGSADIPESPKRLDEHGLDLGRTRQLGDLCKIRIGLVTGDSNFFLFDAEKARRTRISGNWLSPIVSKADQINGLTVSANDLFTAFASGERSAILDTRSRDTEIETEVTTYLGTMHEAKIASNITFQKRDIWHQPFDDLVADAFFTGMSHIAPRMALNPERLHCTNTLYRIFFDSTAALSKKQIALSLASSFGQLSAELEGRPYGSGLLKHEPRDVRRLRVLLDGPDDAAVDATFHKVDICLRNKEFDNAAQIADQFWIDRGFLYKQSLREIERSLDRYREIRLRRTQ